MRQTLSLRCSGKPTEAKGSSWYPSWRAGQKHPQKQQSTELRVPGLPLQLELDASNLVSLKKKSTSVGRGHLDSVTNQQPDQGSVLILVLLMSSHQVFSCAGSQAEWRHLFYYSILTITCGKGGMVLIPQKKTDLSIEKASRTH